MRILRNGLSLRVKITASFVLLVVGGTAVSTLIGSRIITGALLNQARVRVHHGLEAARLIYAERRETVQRRVARAAAAEPLTEATRAGDAARLRAVLAAARREGDLGFLSYLDLETGCVFRPGAADGPPGAGLAALVAEARRVAAVSGTTVLDRETLAREDPALAAEAHIRIIPVPRAAPDPRTEVTSGLALAAAAPVERDGRTVGVVYGGVLLSRNYAIVDQVKGLVYGGEQYQGRDIGTASIFLSDVRVSTNVLTARGERAVGTRVSAEVAEAVLGRGEIWYGRAFVVNGWYVSAYEPLREPAGRIVGMLYVGIPEAPFLAVRTDVMLTFLVVALIGVAVVLGLTYLITRSMIHPLEEMVAATKMIAGGDLNHTVNVPSRDEVGVLAESFNQMVRSLRTMQAELQQWGHTLEEKVRQRTDELSTVQSRMAQSEKLASIGRLAAGVAHEINNPLGGILSLAMLGLEEADAGNPLRGDLEIMVKQTLRCREIVKGLLDFSRQSETRAVRTDVNPIVEGTLSLLERQALFQNIRTTKRFASALPSVLIDPGQLQEVVMNIVLNAVDAMEENGELTVETADDPGHGEVVVHIRDTGKGIPEDVMPFIFEPFFTTKKVGQGTGLGLAIVHGIITRAGGRIEVASSKRGTAFTVRLPVLQEEAYDGATETTGAGAR